MKQKMTRKDLADLFPEPAPFYKSPDGLFVRQGKHAASKRLHRHNHGEATKPSRGGIAAAYRQLHRGKKRK